MPVLVQKTKVSSKQEDKLLAKLNQLEEEYLWISANEEMLKREFLNKYIAVKGKEVVFYSDDFEALMKVLVASNQDIDSFAIKHITKKTSCLIL